MPEIKIRTDTTSLAEKKAARRQRKTTNLIIVGAVAACLVFVALIAATNWRSHDAAPPSAADNLVPGISDGAGNGRSVPQTTGDATPTPSSENLIADDGQSMWVSPTSGRPLDLAYLPPGCELFIALHPVAILNEGEGKKMLAALGPSGQQTSKSIERVTGLKLAQIQRLLIGIRPAAGFALETTFVVTPTDGNAPPTASNHYQPDESSSTYVVAPKTVVNEIKELAGTPPPLRREVEGLIATTDADRHATIVVAPAFLFGDGRTIWQGSLAGLRGPLFALLPDSTRGAALSIHVGNDFFAELRLATTIDQRPQRFADRFAEKVAAWPSAMEREIASMPTSKYSAAVVARLPAMLRVLNRYCRVGIDSKQSLLRVYLPAPAGHNLLMAGELLLAEQMAGGFERGATRPSIAENPRTIEEQLAQRVSVSFARDTLETAVSLLAAEIGIEIMLMGGDLQLDGITKNQSFMLDEQNKPASEILVAILRLANPDKTATGPSDPKQKLVYFLGTKPGTDTPVIFVTTRSQASKRGNTLPSIFSP